ncbi:MAG: hypothetical protein HND58_17780 [Planctomycetota bacterium]|nr:MAG: hypothetical protein HND58_17780 [Planctomycetota bacterium]
MTGKARAMTAVYRIALVLAAGTVGAAGHWGGSMVYGEGYLTEALFPAPAPEPPSAETQLAELAELEASGTVLTVDFATQIMPILEASCIECHGPSKKKGNLRLDSRMYAMDARDADEQVFLPGNAADSEFMWRVTLPHDDPDLMPPEGDGDPLTPEQIALFETWINEGAVWIDVPVAVATEAKTDTTTQNAPPAPPPFVFDEAARAAGRRARRPPPARRRRQPPRLRRAVGRGPLRPARRERHRRRPRPARAARAHARLAPPRRHLRHRRRRRGPRRLPAARTPAPRTHRHHRPRCHAPRRPHPAPLPQPLRHQRHRRRPRHHRQPALDRERLSLADRGLAAGRRTAGRPHARRGRRSRPRRRARRLLRRGRDQGGRRVGAGARVRGRRRGRGRRPDRAPHRPCLAPRVLPRRGREGQRVRPPLLCRSARRARSAPRAPGTDRASASRQPTPPSRRAGCGRARCVRTARHARPDRPHRTGLHHRRRRVPAGDARRRFRPRHPPHPLQQLLPLPRP